MTAGPSSRTLPVQQPATATTRVRAGARAVRHRWDILLVIALGGALGSAARYGISGLLPHAPGELPWSTVAVNVLGSAVLGIFMVFVLEVWQPGRYLRPFFGVGVLGGFTTFSAYMLDTWTLIGHGQPGVAVMYLGGTLIVGLLVLWSGLLTGRLLVSASRRLGAKTRELRRNVADNRGRKR